MKGPTPQTLFAVYRPDGVKHGKRGLFFDTSALAVRHAVASTGRKWFLLVREGYRVCIVTVTVTPESEASE